MLLSLLSCILLYLVIYLLYIICSAKKRHHQTKLCLLTRFILTLLVARWVWALAEVARQDQTFASEWNPYSVLHIEDSGQFNTPEIRDAYKKLSKKYHPDKVDW